jgi:hypothetical protein
MLIKIIFSNERDPSRLFAGYIMFIQTPVYLLRFQLVFFTNILHGVPFGNMTKVVLFVGKEAVDVRAREM